MKDLAAATDDVIAVARRVVKSWPATGAVWDLSAALRAMDDLRAEERERALDALYD